MMILVVYYSCMLTVKLRLLPTKYWRNRVNFASSVCTAALYLSETSSSSFVLLFLLVGPAFPTPYSFSVTFFLPFGLRPFFMLLQINTHKQKINDTESSLSLYRHPFIYTLSNSLFTLIINNKKRTKKKKLELLYGM
jgi:hypothetical protein